LTRLAPQTPSRRLGVPVSVNGRLGGVDRAEVRSELANGAAHAKVVGDLAGMGGVMTLDRAEAVVAAIEQTAGHPVNA